jgi:hypothetical protein
MRERLWLEIDTLLDRSIPQLKHFYTYLLQCSNNFQ